MIRSCSGPFTRALVVEHPDVVLDELLAADGLRVERAAEVPDEAGLIRMTNAGGHQVLFKRSRVPVFAVVPDAARAALGDAVASALQGPDVQARLSAVQFFTAFIATEWDDRLFEAESAVREFAGSKPDDPLEKLFFSRWLAAVGWRLALKIEPGSTAERARDTLRRRACEPPGIGVYAKKLRVCDAEWVAANQHRFVT
jgi:hypothetical protein